MRSHIHELWEDLELSPQYPEPGLDRVMDRVMDQIEAEEPELPASQTRRRRPMHKKKLLLSLAAALVVLTGSAVAVGSQLGLLNLFFQGDTSALEPYVQTDLGSAENEDYRFTVNSAYYDGMTVYATVTVEGLNEQAVEDLKSNKVIAECHREVWGQEMVDGLMKSGSTGPDAIMCNMHAIIMDDGHTYSGTGCGGGELPAPSDTSRSWRVNVSFEQWMGPLNTPLKIWAGFMGEAYAVEIPLDTTAGSVHLESNQEFLLNNLTGARAVLREVALTPTQLYYEYQSIGEDVPDTADMSASDASKYWFILKMKDGSLLTASQIGFNGGSGGTSDSNTGIHSFHFKFKSVKFSEVSEVESIILGDMEFPLDGAKPFPAEIDEHLYPFQTELLRYPVQDEERNYIADVEALCQGLGADYQWDEQTKTVTAAYRGVTVSLTVGSATALVNGEPVEITTTVNGESGEDVLVPMPVVERDGKVAALVSVFSEPWEFWSFTTYTSIEEGDNVTIIFGDLVIIP